MIKLDLDRESLLVHAKGADRLVDLEAGLAAEGLTLDLDAPPDVTVAAWLETGAQGARSAWLDPADHLVAGITTSHFSIKPAPRRAVGPDLLTLVLGAHGQFVQIESVWLRVHHKNITRPAMAFGASEELTELQDAERALFDAIKTEFFR